MNTIQDDKTSLNVPLMVHYHKTPELSASSVFKLRPEELQLFFERRHNICPENRGEKRECLIILEHVGLNEGLLDKLATDAETGIIGDVKDIARRKKFFGENKRSLPTVRSYGSILWDQFQDFFNQLLLVFATLYLLLSFWSDVPYMWLEAVSIYFAVLFAALIGSVCDYGKEQQFLNLRGEIMRESCTVLRGQYGTTQSVLVNDLVVGDVIVLTAGDRVPADCMLIEEMDMTVDEKAYYPDRAEAPRAVKQCSQDGGNNHLDNPDPILLTNSLIMSGNGKAVVLAVGDRTLREVELTKDELKIGEEKTPLMEKLETLGAIVGKWAYVVSAAAFVLFTIFWFCNIMFSEDQALASNASLMKLVKNLIIALALLIVCVPEGMPLAISMAVAFSTDNLKNEALLIKNVEALEISGTLIDIMTGKTATLTEGEMRVGSLYIGGAFQDTDNLELNHELNKTFQQAIILNTEARMEMGDDDHKYIPQGSPVEVGLLKFLIDCEIPVHESLVERERQYKLKTMIPFSSERKIMTVAYQLPGEEGTVRVVVKGAPEYIIPLCSKELDSSNDPNEFEGDGDAGNNHLESIVATDIAKKAQKPLTFAIRDFNQDEFDQLYQESNKFESEQSRQAIESQLTLVATIGLIDPLREGVVDSINNLYESGTNTRILSGDHKESALKTAVDIGIAEAGSEEGVISGAELRAQLNDLLVETKNGEEGGYTYEFKSKDAEKHFKTQIKKRTQVLYRATPADKHMFVAAMKRSGSSCAVTGEGITDALALSEASVGFAMGQDGCAVAKDHADIIITDDNFSSVVNAVRWGRNIFDNCRKFVQFQLTVNISCLFIVILGGTFLGRSPFSVIQLLWINLVMDVMAAIALSTEAPHETKLRAERIKKNDKILTPYMWRAVTSQFLYQAVVMLVLLFAGPAMFGIGHNLITTPYYNADEDKTATYALMHHTFLFQTFMMMNLFNMWNCRKLESEKETEFNVFEGFHRNWWFSIVWFAELNIQFFMVGYPAFSHVFSTTPIGWGMHLTAFILGLGSLGVGAAVKKTPVEWLSFFPTLSESKEEASLGAYEDAFQRSKTAMLMDEE